MNQIRCTHIEYSKRCRWPTPNTKQCATRFGKFANSYSAGAKATLREIITKGKVRKSCSCHPNAEFMKIVVSANLFKSRQLVSGKNQSTTYGNSQKMTIPKVIFSWWPKPELMVIVDFAMFLLETRGNAILLSPNHKSWKSQ